VAALRYEGVGYRELGLERRLVGPALAATGAVVVVVNVAVAGLGMAAGTTVPFGVMAYYLTPPFDYPVGGLVASAATLYVLAGPIEELAFRGYLRNKVTAGVDAGRHAWGRPSASSPPGWRSRCCTSPSTCSSGGRGSARSSERSPS
jgi:hypothetical protein